VIDLVNSTSPTEISGKFERNGLSIESSYYKLEVSLNLVISKTTTVCIDRTYQSASTVITNPRYPFHADLVITIATVGIVDRRRSLSQLAFYFNKEPDHLKLAIRLNFRSLPASGVS
jgi:hypothetical protein